VADSVPSDVQEAGAFGEAAGAFAANAIRAFKQGMRWMPTAADVARRRDRALRISAVPWRAVDDGGQRGEGDGRDLAEAIAQQIQSLLGAKTEG